MRTDRQTHVAPRLGLIADDLTGACDAGVQFSLQGFSSTVQLEPALSQELESDVLILNTQTRHDRPKAAKAKVEKACALLAQMQRRLIYKKIDSTLKGNLATEIAAVIKARGYALAIVAPAFPAMGRIFVNGELWVAGEASIEHLDLLSLFRRQDMRSVTLFNTACVRGGCAALKDKLEDLSRRQPGVAVMDAETDDDLALIARTALKLKIPPLLSGSAGLAAEVAKCYGREYGIKPTSDSKNRASGTHRGSVVLVIGSTNPVTENQVSEFVSSRPEEVVLPAQAAGAHCRRALAENRPVLINVRGEDKDERRVAELLTIAEEPAVNGLILSGGDTADLVCRLLRAEGIKLETEILPGIPCGKLIGGRAHGLPVATKAGGFGQPDALVSMVKYLSTLERSSK